MWSAHDADFHDYRRLIDLPKPSRNFQKHEIFRNRFLKMCSKIESGIASTRTFKQDVAKGMFWHKL